VTRSSATPPRRASSSSSSDTADAGAAADGDYELPSWTRTSDQPTGVLRRAPAKPMDQPQLAAPSAEPALKMIHGENDSDWTRKLGVGSFCYPLSAAARHTPTIGGHPGDGPPICRRSESGVHPLPHPRFAGDRGSTPTPTPDLPLAESGVHPHPRFNLKSGVPCPGSQGPLSGRSCSANEVTVRTGLILLK
jgi:hypothetical protein